MIDTKLLINLKFMLLDDMLQPGPNQSDYIKYKALLLMHYSKCEKFKRRLPSVKRIKKGHYEDSQMKKIKLSSVKF